MMARRRDRGETSRTRTGRRRLLLGLLGVPAGLAVLALLGRWRAGAGGERGMQAAPTVPLELSARPAAPARPFDATGFGIVGVYDIDWLPEPRLLRLLDYAAASPGGVTGVRFFGALSSGTREDTKPVDGGSVWRDRSAPPDFATTLDALAVLTSRGLTPFIAL